jgi:flagellar basal body-associated protein FliL
MRNLKPLMAAMVLIALAVGAYWWVTSNKELMWALTRGSVNKTSSNTAPYEVALRLAQKDGIPFVDGIPAKEWILRLPRTFVTREIGTNGFVFWKTEEERRYFVFIDLNVEPNGEVFTTSVGRSRDRLISRSMLFNLRNDEANPKIAKHDLCVPDNREKDILGPLGYIGASNNPCSEYIPRCPIRMQMSGWSVDLAVSKDLYSNPDQACALARKFLDKYTVIRDELR